MVAPGLPLNLGGSSPKKVSGTFLTEITREKAPLLVAKRSYKWHDNTNFLKKGIFLTISSKSGGFTAVGLKAAGPERQPWPPL
jgi:hypothetical protein